MVGSQLEHLTRRRDILLQDLENFTRHFKPEQIQTAKERLQREYDVLSKGLSNEIEWTPLRKQLERIVPKRLTVGFPFDQAKVPAAERIILPGSILYCPMAAMLSNMDGKRNMAEIVRMVEHETCARIADDRLEEYMQAFRHLAKYGYIDLSE